MCGEQSNRLGGVDIEPWAQILKGVLNDVAALRADLLVATSRLARKRIEALIACVVFQDSHAQWSIAPEAAPVPPQGLETYKVP